MLAICVGSLLFPAQRAAMVFPAGRSLAHWRSRRSGRWHHSHVARCSAQCARHGPTLHKELTGYGPDSGAKTDLTGQGKTCPVFFASGHGRGWPEINVKRHGFSRNTALKCNEANRHPSFASPSYRRNIYKEHPVASEIVCASSLAVSANYRSFHY